jgi:hypothetical protein
VGTKRGSNCYFIPKHARQQSGSVTSGETAFRCRKSLQRKENWYRGRAKIVVCAFALSARVLLFAECAHNLGDEGLPSFYSYHNDEGSEGQHDRREADHNNFASNVEFDECHGREENEEDHF